MAAATSGNLRPDGHSSNFKVSVCGYVCDYILLCIWLLWNSSFKSAIEYDPNWYKAWHSWALMNFEVVSHYEKTRVPFESIAYHVVPAIQGFFRSISLGSGQSLQVQLTGLTSSEDFFSLSFAIRIHFDCSLCGLDTVHKKKSKPH